MSFPKGGSDLVRAADSKIPGIHLRGCQKPFYSAADLFNSDNYRAEGSTPSGDLKDPLGNPFGLAAAVKSRRLRGHWLFWDLVGGFCDRWRLFRMPKMYRVFVELNLRATTPTVLMKIKRGGVGSFDLNAKLIGFRTPATFCLNDESLKFKSTLQSEATCWKSA